MLMSVQMCRALAAFLVAFYHLATLSERCWAIDEGRANWLRVFEAFGFAGVDLFFVISGVVMTVTCYDRLGDPRESIPFLKRRVARIYPLYWFCTLLVIAICWFEPSLAARGKTEPVHILKSLVLWPEDDFPIVSVGWTLSFEMFFYLGFAVLLALPRRAFLPALASWAMLVLAAYALFNDPASSGIRGNLALPLYASPLVLEFIAGCVIGWLYCHDKLPLARTTLVIGLLLFVGLGGHLGMIDHDQGTYGLNRTAVYGVGAVFIIYGAVGMELAGRLRVSRSLAFWGDASYSFYLTHGYVIQFFTLVYLKWSAAHNGWPKTSLLAACLAACGIVAVACHLWVERPMIAWTRRILEGRSLARLPRVDKPAAAN
jgi:peptidoglycan/LPS O-acetylase OafA/YrhL